ncbi:MAG: hypothetical protein LIO45_04915 [Clostridiales bacterium]|nr:hypothetical protein [Clostridiales bacterium]
MNPNPYPSNFGPAETAQFAAMETESRESAAGRRGNWLPIVLLLLAAAVLVALLVVSTSTPMQDISTEEWENGTVVVTTENGVQREREYLDENGQTVKLETFDTSGAMTGYSEYSYTYDDSGSVSKTTEYRYDADGALIGEVASD